MHISIYTKRGTKNKLNEAFFRRFQGLGSHQKLKHSCVCLRRASLSLECLLRVYLSLIEIKKKMKNTSIRETIRLLIKGSKQGTSLVEQLSKNEWGRRGLVFQRFQLLSLPIPLSIDSGTIAMIQKQMGSSLFSLDFQLFLSLRRLKKSDRPWLERYLELRKVFSG